MNSKIAVVLPVIFFFLVGAQASLYSNRLTKVAFFKDTDFRGNQEVQAMILQRCKDLPLVNGVSSNTNSARLLDGGCIRLCPQPCSQNPSPNTNTCIVLTTTKPRIKDLGLLSGGKVRSIQKCNVSNLE